MMRKLKLPPVDPLPFELIMTRQPLSQTLVVVMENMDSYRLTFENMALYLKLVGLGEVFIGEVLDRLRNFFCLHLDIPNQIIETLPRQTVDEAMRKHNNAERSPAAVLFHVPQMVGQRRRL